MKALRSRAPCAGRERMETAQQVADRLVRTKHNYWPPEHSYSRGKLEKAKVTPDDAREKVRGLIVQTIEFARKAQLVFGDVRVNRGGGSDARESSKYPGIYVHTSIALTTPGGRKGDQRKVSDANQVAYRAATGRKDGVGAAVLRGWDPYEATEEVREAIFHAAQENLLRLLDGIREHRQDVFENQLEDCVAKFVAESGVDDLLRRKFVENFSAFLVDKSLVDEDPAFVLRIMKFINTHQGAAAALDSFIRQNKSCLMFVTEEEIRASQQTAAVKEVQDG